MASRSTRRPAKLASSDIAPKLDSNDTNTNANDLSIEEWVALLDPLLVDAMFIEGAVHSEKERARRLFAYVTAHHVLLNKQRSLDAAYIPPLESLRSFIPPALRLEPNPHLPPRLRKRVSDQLRGVHFDEQVHVREWWETDGGTREIYHDSKASLGFPGHDDVPALDGDGLVWKIDASSSAVGSPDPRPYVPGWKHTFSAAAVRNLGHDAAPHREYYGVDESDGIGTKDLLGLYPEPSSSAAAAEAVDDVHVRSQEDMGATTDPLPPLAPVLPSEAGQLNAPPSRALPPRPQAQHAGQAQGTAALAAKENAKDVCGQWAWVDMPTCMWAWISSVWSSSHSASDINWGYKAPMYVLLLAAVLGIGYSYWPKKTTRRPATATSSLGSLKK